MVYARVCIIVTSSSSANEEPLLPLGPLTEGRGTPYAPLAASSESDSMLLF
jgi:hypothetical protein